MPPTSRGRARPILRARLLLAAGLLALAGCEETPVGPDIREIEFAASLDVDIDTFTELPSGVFHKDIRVGEGAPAANGSVVDLAVEGWLPDGAPVQDYFTMTAQVGAGRVIPGLDQALVGMRAGGERKVVVPPHLAHGRDQVMVFRLQVSAVR